MEIDSSILARLQFDSQGLTQTLPRMPARQVSSRIVARESVNLPSAISSTYFGIFSLVGQTLKQGAVTDERYMPALAFCPAMHRSNASRKYSSAWSKGTRPVWPIWHLEPALISEANVLIRAISSLLPCPAEMAFSLSRITLVPILHGRHRPQDSFCTASTYFAHMSTMSTLSSKSAMPSQPMKALYRLAGRKFFRELQPFGGGELFLPLPPVVDQFSLPGTKEYLPSVTCRSHPGRCRCCRWPQRRRRPSVPRSS